MAEFVESEMIHDWNTQGAVRERRTVSLVDHTPACLAAGTDDRKRLLQLADALFVDRIHLGVVGEAEVDIVAQAQAMGLLLALPSVTLPWNGDRLDDAVHLARATRAVVYVAVPAAAADPVAAGARIERLRTAGVAAALWAEDAARAHPVALRRLLDAALAGGADVLCLSDTSGLATPAGAARLVRFAIRAVEYHGGDTRVEWDGGNDRDLALANALAALEAGARALHGSILGIGAGAGPCALDHLLVNLRLLGHFESKDLTRLTDYVETVARLAGVHIPVHYPVFGKDAFRTATGVHAAAIVKAEAKGHAWLADRVYSGVPAAWFGRSQVIDVGPMSGESNVVAWLRHHGHEAQPELVKRIIACAKKSNHILDSDEIQQEIAAFGAAAASHVE